MTKKRAREEMVKKRKRELLMLLDGNAIIHRAFHGVPPLSLPDGTPTNAVYGFTSTLLNVLEKFQPDYVVATFDLPGKTFRHDLYPEYKGKRKELDPDLIPQFDLVKEVVLALNIDIQEKENYEADDVIGTLSKQATAEGVNTVIVTGDKDTLQLVDDHVSVFTMSRGISDMILYDSELVLEKMGVRVEQVTDYKGIRGDSSDNIPGVRGIGEKGATELLGLYGDLDGVYAHIDDVKGAMQKKLLEYKEQAYLSKELGTIDCAVPVTLSLKDSSSAAISFDGARAVFQKFAFARLVKRLDKRAGRIEESAASENVGKSQKKSTKKKVSAATHERASLNSVEAREFLGHCEGKEVVMLLDADHVQLHGAALCLGDRAVYIPYNDDLRASFDGFLSRGKSRIIAYDVKALKHQCRALSVPEPLVWRDLLLLAYCARTGKRIALWELVFSIVEGSHVTQEQKQSQMALDLRDDVAVQKRLVAQVSEVAQVYRVILEEMDVIATAQKKSQAEKNVKVRDDAPTVWHVFDHLEMPLMAILYKMEEAGIAFDPAVFSRIAKSTNRKLEKLTKSIHDHAGSAFNINSTKQLRVVLFETLQLPVAGVTRTKTGYSTASSELEKLRSLHPIIPAIETYRELFKLKTTYIDALPALVRDDGRIHTTYNQAVTSTGRLSSSDPNLQNIPTRTEAGRALRAGFVAGKGKKLISADYSQVELRCVAHVAQDTAMIEAFKKGADIHTFTSARVLGKDMDAISKEERSRAKELNFGLIYGMGSSSFAKAADIDLSLAKDFIAKYFGAFHGVKDYMDQTKVFAHEHGYVETLEGRRYYLDGISSKNSMIRSGAERAAINMPIQGLAAEIMKLAMIAVDRFLVEKYPTGDVRMLLQIHDEIILESPEKNAAKVMKEIQSVMEGVYALSVPLTVDAEIGDHWGEL